MPAPSKYGPEIRDRLKTLWLAGKSAQFIATELGIVSRNAVLRLRAQMKLPVRPSDGPWRIEGQAKRLKNDLSRSEPLQRPKPVQKLLVPSDEPVPVGIMGAISPDGRCKWPVNQDGQEYQDCGAVSEHGRPYCPHHCSRAYNPSHKAMSGSSRSDRQFR